MMDGSVSQKKADGSDSKRKKSIGIELNKVDKNYVEAVIKKLHKNEPVGEYRHILTVDEIRWLIEHAKPIFETQATLIEVKAPVAICGDTHGQFADLLRLFAKGKSPPRTQYLFLGDYIDRGPNSIEVICLMFAYKILNWNEFHVLRGNHETEAINRVYGFYEECHRRYQGEGLSDLFNACFSYMPLAALIDGSILCMHGGISPDIKHLDDIRKIKRPLKEINGGIACDLLWADPDKSVTGFQKSTRGVSYLFGADAVNKFCEEVGVDMIIRAHQVVMEGYEFFCGYRLLTVFSAPNYCNQFDNAAGFVTVNEKQVLRIRQLKSRKESDSKRQPSQSGSISQQSK